jgi:hypothetical protein
MRKNNGLILLDEALKYIFQWMAASLFFVMIDRKVEKNLKLR